VDSPSAEVLQTICECFYEQFCGGHTYDLHPNLSFINSTQLGEHDFRFSGEYWDDRTTYYFVIFDGPGHGTTVVEWVPQRRPYTLSTYIAALRQTENV
jgi:hypothetical protein